MEELHLLPEQDLLPGLHLLPGERLDGINENLRLIQKTDGLTFGTDAYLLAAFLRSGSKTMAAELGGGTGVLSLLALTKQKASRTDVYEIQPEFAELCRRNAALNGLTDRMHCSAAMCGRLPAVSRWIWYTPILPI